MRAAAHRAASAEHQPERGASRGAVRLGGRPSHRRRSTHRHAAHLLQEPHEVPAVVVLVIAHDREPGQL